MTDNEKALQSILKKIVNSGTTQVTDKKTVIEMNTRDFLKLIELVK